MVVGSGAFRFRWIKGWGRTPHGMTLGDVPGVAVDSKDRVFAFQRGEPPIVVFDRGGEFVTSWGDGVFKRTHGIHIAADDSVYCVGDLDHAVRKFTADGKPLMTLGTPGRPSDTGWHGEYDTLQGGGPFNRPTNLAVF